MTRPVSPKQGRPLQARSELRSALAVCRHAFVGVALVSGMINLLYLTGSFFMLQVYDRVLPSGSVPTLVALAGLAAALYLFQGVLDMMRGRLLVRVGGSIDASLNQRLYEAVVRLPLRSRAQGDGLLPLRDLDQVRSFLSGAGPLSLFDLPWLPVYLGICFLFHFWIGVTALVGALLLIGLTVVAEVLTRAPAQQAVTFAVQRNALAEGGRRNAEALQAMGMERRARERWAIANSQYMEAQRRASDVGGGLGAVSKVARMLLQSAVLAVGAYLVIRQEATGGIIIAGSILSARALAPVELAIGNWKGFVSARQSWRRLSQLLAGFPQADDPLLLPKPRASLSVETVAVAPPGDQKIVAMDVSFQLKAGQGLGIIGPSGSGKSSLARALVGVWRPARGKIRLDGAALEQWSPEALGPHIGYMPQDVELFAGTVAENIARLESDPEPARVIEAAQAANVHDLILSLPEGYETQIGEGGQALSGGQRQRIALARALYGDPFLVVLDEPNSNLDAQGEAALTKALLGVRARGGIVVIVAHRPSALAGVDHVLMMAGGKVQSFGPKEEVLRKVLQPAPTPNPLKIVGGAQG